MAPQFPSPAAMEEVDTPQGEACAPDALVSRIKATQRESELARMEWRSYCDTHGNRTRDPRLHSADFLRTFFELRETGALPVGPPPLYKQPMPEGASPEAQVILTEKVKHGQRASRMFKDRWRAYCAERSHGTQDPSRHDFQSLHCFLQRFAAEGGRVPDMPLSPTPSDKPPMGGIPCQAFGGPICPAPGYNLGQTNDNESFFSQSPPAMYGVSFDVAKKIPNTNVGGDCFLMNNHEFYIPETPLSGPPAEAVPPCHKLFQSHAEPHTAWTKPSSQISCLYKAPYLGLPKVVNINN